MPDSAAKLRTISGMAKYYGSFLSHRNSQKSQKFSLRFLSAARAEGTFRDFRDFCVTKNKVNDKYLELTTTWTTKTTQPLATVSPFNVVNVVIVVVKLGVRRTKENLCNLCNLCDNKYPADWITYLVFVSGERWLQTPRKVVPFWQKGGTFLTSHPLYSLHFYSSWVQGVTVEIHKFHAYRVYARYA